MSLPATPSCWQVYFVGMLPLLANAVLVNANPGGGVPPPPANFSRTITLSSVPGVPPFLSLLVEVSHSPPSGDLTTVRSRPQRLLKNARGVSVLRSPVMCMTHSRAPRTAAMYSQSLTISRPLGEADA